MKRQLAVVLVATFLIAGLVSAEGKSEGGKPGGKVIELNMAWWGAQARHDKFNAILDLYEKKNPSIKIVRQYAPWGDYWSKLATQAAGGTLPDSFGMTAMAKGEYASKGTMVPLQPYVDKKLIDISDFTKGAIDAGKVDGVLYMITMGDTAATLVYNKKLVGDAGYAPPKDSMTLSEQKQYLLGLQPKLPKGVWAEWDDATFEHAFENLVRQRGYELTTPDGKKPGYPKDVVKEYFSFWAGLSKAGAVPTPAIMAEQAGRQWADTMMVRGLVASWYTNVNQLPIFQSYSKDELTCVRAPVADNAKEKYVELIQPSSWTIAKNAKDKDEVARVISFFVNDLEAQKIFALELGAPGSTKVTKMLIDNLKPDTDVVDKTRKRMLEFMNQVLTTVNVHPGRKAGAPALITDMTKKYQEYSFGRMTLDQAVDAHFNALTTILQ